MLDVMDMAAAGRAVLFEMTYCAAFMGLLGGVSWGLSFADYKRGKRCFWHTFAAFSRGDRKKKKGGPPPTVFQNTMRCALGLAPVLVGAQCMTMPVEPALTLMMITVTGDEKSVFFFFHRFLLMGASRQDPCGPMCGLNLELWVLLGCPH